MSRTAGRTLGPVYRLLAAVILLAASRTPAQGQYVQGAPPPGPMMPAPAPAIMGNVTTYYVPEVVEEPPGIELYVSAGPVYPLGSKFIEDRLNTGWAFQFGYRNAFRARPDRVLFADFGLGYATNDGDRRAVVSPGFFQGILPPDDHIHVFENFVASELLQLERFSSQVALGAHFYPAGLNGRPDRRVRFTVRGGTRFGFLEADFIRLFAPDVVESIRDHFGHGHQDLFFSTLGGEDPELYFGLFGSIGAGVTYNDVRVGQWWLGNVTFGVEVEFGQDWFHLGEFEQDDKGLATVVPMFTLAFSF